jgi:hypothetical protein
VPSTGQRARREGVGHVNFLLAEEPSLAAWRSGALWADLRPKPSFGALADVAREVQAGDVDCSVFPASAGTGQTLTPEAQGGRRP